MYIKEDLIIPHVSPSPSFNIGRYSCAYLLALSLAALYFLFVARPALVNIRVSRTDGLSPDSDDFIVNKYRGKSGPMFNFDVHEDIRLTHDAAIEKDEVS